MGEIERMHTMCHQQRAWKTRGHATSYMKVSARGLPSLPYYYRLEGNDNTSKYLPGFGGIAPFENDPPTVLGSKLEHCDQRSVDRLSSEAGSRWRLEYFGPLMSTGG